MKCLPYCILRDREGLRDRLPAGPEGYPVSLAAAEGLAVAFSRVLDDFATASVARALAFARVIEALHRDGTVLPMRYGGLLETEEQLQDLLRTRRAAFTAALADLDGCAEMGLRVLDAGTEPAADVSAATSGGPGAAYLAARKARYDAEEQRRAAADRLGQQIRDAFAGRFRRCGEEPAQGTGRFLLSLNFLVRRDEVEAFQEASRRLEGEIAEKLLLTGPWPPYHFAAAE